MKQSKQRHKMDAMTNRKVTKLILLFAVVAFLLLLPSQAANNVVMNTTQNNTSFTTNSYFTEIVGSNRTVLTGTGNTSVLFSLASRVNLSGKVLYARVMRDGAEIGRYNVTASPFESSTAFIVVQAETEGTHQYNIEVYSTGLATIYRWSMSVLYLQTGTYLASTTGYITNSTAQITIPQVTDLQAQQNTQNASTANLQYNSTVYNTKFDNQNTTNEGLKVNDTTHDQKFDNQNTTNEGLKVNDTTTDQKFNNVNTSVAGILTNNSNQAGYDNATFLPIVSANSMNLSSHNNKTWAQALFDLLNITDAYFNSTFGKQATNNTNVNLSLAGQTINNSNFNNSFAQQATNNTNFNLSFALQALNNTNFNTTDEQLRANDTRINNTFRENDTIINSSYKYNDTVHDQKFNNVNSTFLPNSTYNGNFTNGSMVVTSNTTHPRTALHNGSSGNLSYNSTNGIFDLWFPNCESGYILNTSSGLRNLTCQIDSTSAFSLIITGGGIYTGSTILTAGTGVEIVDVSGNVTFNVPAAGVTNASVNPFSFNLSNGTTGSINFGNNVTNVTVNLTSGANVSGLLPDANIASAFVKSVGAGAPCTSTGGQNPSITCTVITNATVDFFTGNATNLTRGNLSTAILPSYINRTFVNTSNTSYLQNVTVLNTSTITVGRNENGSVQLTATSAGFTNRTHPGWAQDTVYQNTNSSVIGISVIVNGDAGHNCNVLVGMSNPPAIMIAKTSVGIQTLSWYVLPNEYWEYVETTSECSPVAGSWTVWR